MPCEALLNSKELLEKAFAQLNEGSFEDAIESFTDCLLLDPSEAKAYQGKALANFKIKNWPAALSDFKKAKELNPADPENGIGVAMCLAMTQEIYPAIDMLEAVIKEHPQNTRAIIQLGTLYYKLGIIKKGHAAMEQALTSRPTLEERRMIEESMKQQDRKSTRLNSSH